MRILFAFLAGCIFLVYCRHQMQPRVGQGAALSQCPVKGLPPSATNISYCLRGVFGPADYYEFDVPESDFLRWAQSNGWSPQRVTTGDQPLTMYRYGMTSMRPGDPEKVEIGAGYGYGWINPAARDDRLSIGYDLNQHRAFYDRSYR